MSSIISKFLVFTLLMQALGGCSTYVSQLEGQAFEPVDTPVSLASEQPQMGQFFALGKVGFLPQISEHAVWVTS